MQSVFDVKNVTCMQKHDGFFQNAYTEHHLQYKLNRNFDRDCYHFHVHFNYHDYYHYRINIFNHDHDHDNNNYNHYDNHDLYNHIPRLPRRLGWEPNNRVLLL